MILLAVSRTLPITVPCNRYLGGFGRWVSIDTIGSAPGVLPAWTIYNVNTVERTLYALSTLCYNYPALVYHCTCEFCIEYQLELYKLFPTRFFVSFSFLVRVFLCLVFILQSQFVLNFSLKWFSKIIRSVNEEWRKNKNVKLLLKKKNSNSFTH